jgi:signal transduction histidine kinase
MERQLAAVDGQIDRLHSLLGTLLDVSRVSAGKLTLDLCEVDLAEVVREVAGRLEPEAASRATTIRVGAEAAIGRWDRARLDQVVTNLLTNALKYGGGRPVVVEVLAQPGVAVLRVRDQGIGIAPEDLSTVFNEFERAGNAAPFSGLGLGLWIVRKLVAAHGGEVSVESALGQGSTFTVRLPRNPPA